MNFKTLSASALLTATLLFTASSQAQHRHHPQDGGWRPGPEWNSRFSVNCGSDDYRYRFCQVDLGHRGRVSLDRQMSKARCIKGRTWGTNRAGIWVDKGCAARFSVNRRW